MKFIPVLFFLSFLLVLTACDKDKFETTPKLEIKDYNTRTVTQGGLLRVRIDYFDKEGDLDEGSFTGVLRRINQLPLPIDQDKADTLRYPLPKFPPKDQGEITFEQGFDFLKESLVENDTIYFQFVVGDRAGNISDTVNSDIIVIVKP